MSKVFIRPYKYTSMSAKELSKHTGWPIMKRVGSIANKEKDIIVCWGCTDTTGYRKVLNGNAARATNKLHAFKALNAAGVSVPEFTTSKDVAKQWLKDGQRVFARTLLNSRSGKGIVNVKGAAKDLPDAPLYVKYVKKAAEYRVHVVGGKAIFVQQKRKKGGVPNVDAHIRSHLKGWVFCVHNVDPVEGLEQIAIDAVKALDLDFGGVDVIYGHDKKLYVLEVNTAPGLDSSGPRYKDAMKALVGGI